MRSAMVGVAALAVVGGCGREPATSASSADPPVPSSSTTVGGLGSASPTLVRPTTRTIAIKVSGGQAGGDIGRVTVPRDTPVTLSVASDVADEIHVHGYDRKAEIPAGGTASVSFTANISGVFEVELHGSELQLLQLQVS